MACDRDRRTTKFFCKTCPPLSANIDIDKPRYSQNSYFGRVRHFAAITNPFYFFASNYKLERAEMIVKKYRCKEVLPFCLNEDELWAAKYLYDSCYHPDTGEKMNRLGRINSQVPINMLIISNMLLFYKHMPMQIFLQWVNQSYNALTNYTNRGGTLGMSNKVLFTAYVTATASAVATALAFKRLTRHCAPIVCRFLPLTALAVGNSVNVPIMRVQELKYGTPIYDHLDNKIGNSKNAAHCGIFQVVLCRFLMIAPAMIFTPLLIQHLERRGTICRYPWMNLPLQIFMVGLLQSLTIPLAQGVFPQRSEIKFCDLECGLKEKLYEKMGKNTPYLVFYNRGL